MSKLVNETVEYLNGDQFDEEATPQVYKGIGKALRASSKNLKTIMKTMQKYDDEMGADAEALDKMAEELEYLAVLYERRK